MKKIKFPYGEFAEKFAQKYAAQAIAIIAEPCYEQKRIMAPYYEMRAEIRNENEVFGWAWRGADYLHFAEKMTPYQVGVLLCRARLCYSKLIQDYARREV